MTLDKRILLTLKYIFVDARECTLSVLEPFSRVSQHEASLSRGVICFVIAVRTIWGQLAGDDFVVGRYSDRRGVSSILISSTVATMPMH
jgi:hypothetical protein